MRPKSTKIHVTCPNCGNQYLAYPSAVARGRKYCSLACWRMVQVQPLEQRFWSKVDKSGDCWIWTDHLTKDGYGEMWLDGKHPGAHRVAYELTYGPIPDGLWVLHRCDNPPCVRPDHLFLGTNQDNIIDASQKGRLASGKRHWSRTHPERLTNGERHWKAKLTEKDVRDIRKQHAETGASIYAIAAQYEVTPSSISRVIRRDTWKHVK